MSTIAHLTIEMAANVARLRTDMDRATSTVDGAMAKMSKAASLAGAALGAIGVALTAGAFVNMIKGSIDAADALKDLGKSTGLSVERLAGLKLASAQSGANLEGTAAAINKLSVNMGKNAEKFAAIGITAKDPLEAFKQLSDVFVSIKDPQERAALGAAALGKSWAEAAPLLSEGGQKIGEMVDKGTSLSGITTDMANNADAFNDKVAALGTSLGGMGTAIASAVLPGLNSMMDSLTGDIIPAVKDGLSGAFAAVSEWVERNREALGEYWEQVKGLYGDVWEVVKAFASVVGAVLSVAGAIFEAVMQTGVLAETVKGVRLFLALAVDTVNLLAGAFAKAGGMVLQALIHPLANVVSIVGKIRGALGDAAGASEFAANAAGMKEFAAIGVKYGDSVVQKFRDGKGAVSQLSAELASTGKAAAKAGAAIKAMPGRPGQGGSGNTTYQASALKDFIGGGGGGKGGGGKSAAATESDYAKITKALAEKIALEQQELDLGRELSAAEKERIKVVADMDGAKQKLTEAERANVLANLANLQALAKENDWIKKANEENKKHYEALDKTTESLRDQVKAQTDANAKYGLSAKALADLEVAKLKDLAADKLMRASVADTIDVTGRQGDVYREQANLLNDLAAAKVKAATDPLAANMADTLAAYADETTALQQTNVEREVAIKLREAETLGLVAGSEAHIAYGNSLRDSIGKKDLVEAGIKAAKDADEEWKKTSDSIESSLTDALLRGFESGKGFGKNLVDTLKNMFSTLVLKPIISAVMNPVAQGITGALGLSGAAQAGQGGGGPMGMLSNLGSMASSIGQVGSQVLAGSMSVANAFGTVAANITGAGIDGLLAVNGAFGTAGGAAGGLAGAMGSIGTAMPFVGAALAAITVIKKLDKGEKRSGGTFAMESDGSTKKLHGPSGSYDDTDVKKAITATTAGINALLKSAGSAATVAGFHAGLETSSKGRGGVMAGGALSTGQSFGESGKGSNYAGTYYEKTSSQSGDMQQIAAAFAADLSQVTIQALQAATDIPKAISDQLKGIDAESLSAEAAAALVESIAKQVDSVAQFRAAVELLPFDNLKGLSFEASAGLLAAAGGLDKLSAGLTSYYDNFYTESEKSAKAITDVQAALGGLGATGIDTRDEFRALVEAQDLTTEAGQKTYASLMAMNGAFAQAYPAMADVATASSEVAQSAADLAAAERALHDERMGLMESLWQAVGNTQAQRQAALEKLDPSNRPIQEAIYAINDAQSAFDALGKSIAAQKETLTSTYEAAKAAITAGAESQKQAISAQADAQKDAITKTLKATQDGYSLQIKAAQDAANAMRSIASALANAIKQVQIQGDAFDFARLKDARATISGAMGASDLTQVKGLEDALGTAGQDSQQFYSTFEGYALDQAITAGQIAALNDRAQSQVASLDSVVLSLQAASDAAGVIAQAQIDAIGTTSAAQLAAADAGIAAQIAALDKQYALDNAALDLQLSKAQEQLNALLGINTSVQSVAAAMGVFNTALAAAKAAAAPLSASGGASIGSDGSVVTVGGSSAGAQTYSNAVSVQWIKDVIAAGQTPAQVITNAWSQYGANETDVRMTARAANIPGFRIGTNYVPQDMLAQIHEGEAIVPKAYNPAAGGGTNTARLEALVEVLTAQVAALQAPAEKTAAATKKQADMFETVTESGRAMQTEVYA